MDGASDRSVCNGETPHKHWHAVAKKNKSPSEKSMSRKAVKTYLSTSNEGGDPVTAMALRPGSSSEKSSADRQARVQHEMDAALRKMNKTQ
ncbi:hypothetical protein PG985_009718 [Apiospora marii]|uniref:uncharacterized protein n=1 Tax=Apiospora marii TaxID=335849 RepID=UPI00312E562A